MNISLYSVLHCSEDFFLLVWQTIRRPRRGADDPRHEHVRLPLDLVEAVDALLPILSAPAELELIRGPGEGEAKAFRFTTWRGDRLRANGNFGGYFGKYLEIPSMGLALFK